MTEHVLEAKKPDVWTPSKDSELSRRAFGIETLPFRGREVRLVSLEADYTTDERITPPDWQDRVSQAMQGADLTFVEYFTPELEQKMPYFHQLGSFSRNIANVYGAIADMAHEQSQDVAVADIANKPLYEVYHLGVFPAVGAAAIAGARRGDALGWATFLAGETYVAAQVHQTIRKKGTYAVKPSRIERYMPNANDARHVLTARAIAQTVQQYPPQSSFLYIAAPAHTARIKSMLEEPPTAVDSAKYALYKRAVGLDKDTRIYRPTDDGWEQLPTHNPQ
jgi:hypothetical protein